MNLFDLFRIPDINSGLKKYRNTNGAVLLDVRTEEEFAEGHIEMAVNIPVESIGRVRAMISDKNTPVFTYCYSGGRSAEAASAMKRMGYSNVTNIGGIASYRGSTVN